MSTDTALDRLAARLGCAWPHLYAAARDSELERQRLTEAAAAAVPPDASMVVFGSLARGELTAGSDLDWTLLIDGPAARDHIHAVRQLSVALTDAGVRPPGPSGVFGNLTFSHPILHQIGGQDDSNRNTTQRILLLLESQALGQDAAYERVLRLVVERYVEDDRGLRYSKAGSELLPRVLLNDISRYWRTLTIDFVSKQSERDDGWSLRNIKLRLSRKLIFVSGLLICFAAELYGEREALRCGDKVDPDRIVTFLLRQLRGRPLDRLAEACLRPDVRPETARALFDSYDAFLAALSDEERRGALKRHSFDDPRDSLGSRVFTELSRIAHRFQDEGVHRLFFEDDEQLRRLITRHGVF
ncbi:MAG: nucleotidyltransferase domain-containing protein [Nannocystis sp.]|nr:nucleotidyltransferase domain-containing protein [Nannocystis sp.]